MKSLNCAIVVGIVGKISGSVFHDLYLYDKLASRITHGYSPLWASLCNFEMCCGPRLSLQFRSAWFLHTGVLTGVVHKTAQMSPQHKQVDPLERARARAGGPFKADQDYGNTRCA